ncbi:MAG: glycosyl hydrolase family 28-related protein [Capsulimonadaceae bacterium]|nr:glycosyl hydrolase family 28-related protein [Capsulimonadaceae bacterium]
MNNFVRFTQLGLLAACLLAGGSSHAGNLAPRLIHTTFATPDYVIAVADVSEKPYAARADGEGDAAQAIQEAIDDVAKIGGGVVFIPAGRYRCESPLQIREGVTLRGDYLEPQPDAGRYKVAGTILMPVANRGDVNGAPFVTLERGSGIRNLSIWYPNQSADAVTPYPWTIISDPKAFGDCYTIQDVTLVNSYMGVRFGPSGNEIGTLRHVYGTPLRMGVSADSVTDIPRIEHVRFSPRYWADSGLSGAGTVAQIKKALGVDSVGIEMLRVDWYYLFDVAVSGYGVGYHFDKGPRGGACGVMFDASADGGDIGVKADYMGICFQFANCRFDGASAAVDASPQFTTQLQFNNCRLGGNAVRAIRLDGKGSVRAQNCDILSAGGPAIEATAGSLGLVACHFPGKGQQVVLGRGVRRAIIAGGLDASQVASKGVGDVQISSVAPSSLKPPDTKVVLPDDRRPAKPLLFNVVDFGAKADGNNGADATDNTAAFQRALDKAGRADGGTVYVPAGSYRFGGILRVPSGVELRGVFDVPHHTMSWGSTLMPLAGRGLESGTPFITLMPNSGARGLTFWYPEQRSDDVTAYPWTIRALGPSCWVIDITTANSYQFVDFGSHPSDGSLLRFVSGAPLRRGIWVSKGSAEVDDGMFNPHYWLRRPKWAPPVTNSGGDNVAGDQVIDYERAYLDAFAFGDCRATQQVDNFVYASNNGLLFTADGGRASAGIVINHGTDGCTTGLRVTAAEPAGLQIVNAELANVGKLANTAVEIDKDTTGPVNFFNGVTWGRRDIPSLILDGAGKTTFQNWGTELQPAHAKGGELTIQNAAWTGSMTSAIVLDGPLRGISLVANTIGDQAFAFDGPSGPLVRMNGAEIQPVPLVDTFRSGFEPSDPTPTITPRRPTGVIDPQCTVQPGAGRSGGSALVLTASPLDATSHGIAYFAVYDVNIPVKPTTLLRYWIRPGTAMGTHAGVDLEFTEGKPLRDSGGVQSNGGGSHPAGDRGALGRWTMIEVPLANQAGRTIKSILFAFDHSGLTGPVQVAVDDIEIGDMQGD